MGLTVTEDTPADMLAGNMELLVQLPPRVDEDYENGDIYDGDDVDHVHQHHRNHHRHHNHHHNNGHHQRRTVNGNARRVTVARSTPMMDLLVQVATSQKLSASSYTLEAIGEHGLVLTHHPNTPIGALDALQVKLLPKQGTFVPSKTRHVNQPFEQTFRLQVHLPRNQLYVSRVSSRMNLGKILDDVCREKNLDRNNYELCHPANIEEVLDLSLSLQDYHLQEVTLCPKRRSLGSSLSSQDIMALQRQEERRRQEAKQSVFGFAFKKSKESSLSTDSLGERSVSPARSDGTGRSASPQAPTAPTRPQRKRRPAPKPPMPKSEPESKPEGNSTKETEKEKERENDERIIVISHSRNSSDSSGYHEASVLSDNLDSNIRVPETLPRRSKLQSTPQESPNRTLAESSQASKSLGNLAAVPRQRTTIARGASNSSLMSAGLRKKKAAPAPPEPRPLSSAISTQGLERIVDSEESLTSISESIASKASSDVAVASKRDSIVTRMSFESDDQGSSVTPKNEIQEIIKVERKIERIESVRDSPALETPKSNTSSMDPNISSPEENVAENPIVPNVEPARERKRGSGDDQATLSTVQITKGEETTSDLLKKVSDTLSGSLRSPTVAGATSSLANEDQSNPHCVDKSGPGDAIPKVNEAKRVLKVNENLWNTANVLNNERSSIDQIADSNFLDNREAKEKKEFTENDSTATTSDSLQHTTLEDIHLSSTSTDWEYILPEPPTAFRDTNLVDSNRRVFTSASSSKTISSIEDTVKPNVDVISNEKAITRFTETLKSKGIEQSVVTNGTTTLERKSSNLRNENNGIRSRTISSSSEIGSESMAIEKGRLGRTGMKSSIDSDSRRGSQASSTPSIAPADNTLSNFVITTYTRPKNVDIFDEIEEIKREPEVTISRKNSTSDSGHVGNSNIDSRRSSTVLLNKDQTRTLNHKEEKFDSIIPQQKSLRPEITQKVKNDLENSEKIENLEINGELDKQTVNRSNIKISIASKPRPRGDSMNEKQRPKSVLVYIGENDSSKSIQDIKSVEETDKELIPVKGNKKFSQWRENLLNKQEIPNPTNEKQLQSLQVLRSVLPQLDDAQGTSDDSNVTEKANSNSSEEIRVQVASLPINEDTIIRNAPNLEQQVLPKESSSNEPRVKRYTYAGPPAINLGSWSDRSRTTRVQIKPDNDYKVEKIGKTSEVEESVKEETSSFKKKENHNGTTSYNTVVNNKILTTNNPNSTTVIGHSPMNLEKEFANPGLDNYYKDGKKEPDELAKTLIARTTAGGFKRPVSMSFDNSGTIIRFKKENDDVSERMNGGIRLNQILPKEKETEKEKEEEIDSRPRNFKELKEAFAKDQNTTNSISIPKYGTLIGRRSENSTTKITVRRDSDLSSNGENHNHHHHHHNENTLRSTRDEPQGIENSRINNKPSISVQEKRNFVVPIPQTNNNRNSIQDSVRKTSKVTLMPVVKGFKVPVLNTETHGADHHHHHHASSNLSQEKRTAGNYSRVAIGDISNGNYMPMHNGAKKIIQVNKTDDFSPPKPPTMPVITGVTLKSNNNQINQRPKSMPVEPVDTRNELLESIRNFGGQNQLRRGPGRNTNIVAGSRSVRYS